MDNKELREHLSQVTDYDLSALSENVGATAKENGLPQRSLYVAYNFPPFADASAVTVAKRIQQIGWQGEAIAQDMSKIRHTDDDLQQLIEPYISHVHRLKGVPRFSSWRDIRNYVLAGYSRVKSQLTAGSFGLVYSRALFPAPHFLAAYIKAKHPEVTWVAEFSDPVRHDVEGNIRASGVIEHDLVSDEILQSTPLNVREILQQRRDVMSWCDALGSLSSDRPLYTNVNQATVMLEPYIKELDFVNQNLLRPVVSPHPTLPEQFYRRRRILSDHLATDTVNIGYFGEFYPNRGVGELLRAIEQLDKKKRARIVLHIYTSAPEKAAKQISPKVLQEGVVILNSARSLFDFLKLAQRMDALYVADVTPGIGYRLNPYLPSKLSDYRGSGTPIIASVWPGSVMSEDGTLEQFLIGDVPRLAHHLDQLITNKFPQAITE